LRNRLIRNAEPLEAVGAMATAFAALTALVGIAELALTCEAEGPCK